MSVIASIDNVNCVFNSYLSAIRPTAHCSLLYFILLYFITVLLSSAAVQHCKGRFTNPID